MLSMSSQEELRRLALESLLKNTNGTLESRLRKDPNSDTNSQIVQETEEGEIVENNLTNSDSTQPIQSKFLMNEDSDSDDFKMLQINEKENKEKMKEKSIPRRKHEDTTKLWDNDQRYRHKDKKYKSRIDRLWKNNKNNNEKNYQQTEIHNPVNFLPNPNLSLLQPGFSFPQPLDMYQPRFVQPHNFTTFVSPSSTSQLYTPIHSIPMLNSATNFEGFVHYPHTLQLQTPGVLVTK